jgi:two-component system, LytTR family, response regulator
MKALIVDDERIGRQELRRLLLAHPEIEIAAEAQNGEQALGLIPKIAPDVIFLDIQMPEMTGFELLAKLDDVPQIIFTTAYDEYAIRAFEVSALDYLLKPIAPARLAAAVAKLRPRRTPPRLEQVFVRDGERCWLIRVADIYLLESEGNYTRICFKSERPSIAKSLAALEAALDPAIFFRTSRSQIVNLKWIEKVETGPAGNLVITLRTGQTIAASRRQSAALKEALSL